MRISDRILAICNAIKQGESVADIGTDHGYVPFLLYRSGVSPVVIMSDISEGSLAKARQTFREGCFDLPDGAFRVGDGLYEIGKGEVDSIIIAGLGGDTIIDILDADPVKSRSFKRIVTQPRKKSDRLRYYMYTHGYDAAETVLAREGSFVCEVITFVPSNDIVREAPYPQNDIRWKYPSEMINCDRELLGEKLSATIDSLELEAENLTRSRTDKSTEIKEVRKKIDYLKKQFSLK